ncbi:TPA: acetaldehyde dehydrogenase (acetylating) [Pseudomonas aeruginosa]
MNEKIRCAVIGSSSIGMDLIYKLRRSPLLEPVWMVDLDPESKHLAEAKALGIKVTHQGVKGVLPHIVADGVKVAFYTSSSSDYDEVSRSINALGVLGISLVNTEVGTLCIPSVNLSTLVGSGAQYFRMVSGVGQVTIPIVKAISQVQRVDYGEIVVNIKAVSVVGSASDRVNSVVQEVSAALMQLGGASKGKVHAIIRPLRSTSAVLSTISCIVCDQPRRDEIVNSVRNMVGRVQQYLPSYHLIGDPIFDSNLIRFDVSNGGMFEDLEGQEVMACAAVHTAEGFVNRINSICRLCSDFDVLPT